MRLRSLILAALIPLMFIGGMVLSASSTSVQQSQITVKPATPRYTLTESFRSYYNVQEEVEAFIRENVRKGYVVKAVSMAEYSGGQRAVVVMEKY